MLGGTTALAILLTLSMPCAGTIPCEPAPLAPDAPVEEALATVPDPGQLYDAATELPADPDRLITTDPVTATLATLTEAQLPARAPSERLMPPAATLPGQVIDPVGHVPAPPLPVLTPREPHTMPATSSTPRVTGQAIASEHAPPGEPASITGAPIDGSDPARTLAALLVGLASIGLYHRLTKDRVLEHTTRQRILDLLDERPGWTTGELARALDVSYRTARHHAEMLASFDLVSRVDPGGAERWCLPGDAREIQAPISDRQRRVLTLVEASGGLHLSEIARRLGMAKATAKYQLDQLAERGWVQDEQVGPLRRFTASEDGRERLRIEG